MSSIIFHKAYWKRWLKTVGVLFFWLIIWQLISVTVQNEILIVSPIKVIQILGHLMQTVEFYQIILSSCKRVAEGILVAVFIGSLLGMIAYRLSFVEMLIAPFVEFMRSIPVASFVILALIWMGSENLTFCVVFVVSVPIAYSGMLTGCQQTPKAMLEMANVFQMNVLRKIWYIYRPACMPFLNHAISTIVGLGWKSGVAAEVIGTPIYSIGERLYMAKIYLETGELFAWTVVIIFLSFVFERMVQFLFWIISNNKIR